MPNRTLVMLALIILILVCCLFCIHEYCFVFYGKLYGQYRDHRQILSGGVGAINGVLNDWNLTGLHRRSSPGELKHIPTAARTIRDPQPKIFQFSFSTGGHFVKSGVLVRCGKSIK